MITRFSAFFPWAAFVKLKLPVGWVSNTAPLSLWWRVTFHQSVQFKRATVSVGVAHGFQGQSFTVESSGIFPLAASELLGRRGIEIAHRLRAFGGSATCPLGNGP
jgi:hypothetical protein